jgi:3-dehydroquinate synthase
MNNVALLSVNLGPRSYQIAIGTGLLQLIGEYIQKVAPHSIHTVIVCDSSVHGLGQQLSDRLGSSGNRCDLHVVASGESSKSIQALERLWGQLLSCRADRGSLILAVGGGVVGDLAGFAAATFARGLMLVQVPTTLLSQVDSSVGGKTGVNLPGAKNIVGAFWQPSLVLIDTETLTTLPAREYRSGLAEVVKYGVILLPELFGYLEINAVQILNREPTALKHLIFESCRAKAMVVEQDERETTGLRAILNYGHTFAHAIEATAGYGKWLHGEAVSIGMHMAANLAAETGHCDPQFVHRQRRLLESLGLPIAADSLDAKAMWEAMQHDKKVQHGKLKFIVPTKLGHVEAVAGFSWPQVNQAILAATI